MRSRPDRVSGTNADLRPPHRRNTPRFNPSPPIPSPVCRVRLFHEDFRQSIAGRLGSSLGSPGPSTTMPHGAGRLDGRSGRRSVSLYPFLYWRSSSAGGAAVRDRLRASPRDLRAPRRRLGGVGGSPDKGLRPDPHPGDRRRPRPQRRHGRRSGPSRPEPRFPMDLGAPTGSDGRIW